MAYNNYGNYGYGMYPQYNPSMGYQTYQQTMQNQMAQNQIMQPQAQSSEIPFSESHYGTMKEAEAYIVPPMKSVLFMNKANGEIYVKSADNMGNPVFETFKKVGAEIKAEVAHPQIKFEDYVKREQLKDYITFDDLKRIEKQLDDMGKRIDKALRIKDLIGEKENGKQ